MTPNEKQPAHPTRRAFVAAVGAAAAWLGLVKRGAAAKVLAAPAEPTPEPKPTIWIGHF